MAASEQASHWKMEERIEHFLNTSEDIEKTSVTLQKNINKIEEDEEPRFKFSQRNTMRKTRPKSANRVPDSNFKPRPKSSETFRSSRSLGLENGVPVGEERKQKRGLHHVRGCCCCCCSCCCCWREARKEFAGPTDFRLRSWSGCGGDDSCGEPRHAWTHFQSPNRTRWKCRSDPNVSHPTFLKRRKAFDAERGLCKMKRSLKLLGLELSDFGINSSRTECSFECEPGRRRFTFSTKTTSRSISLDSLRATVRQAWANDCLDESHRKLMAQAAYEEWYFRKERDLRAKREAERQEQANARKSIREDFQKKKEKSEQEFKKWLNRKSSRSKQSDRFQQRQKIAFARQTKTKEESEKAFLTWKCAKEKELRKRKKEERIEEERKVESEKEKSKKKIIAEKAFQQWKIKIAERERLKEVRRKKRNQTQEMQEIKKKEEGSKVSFEVWKAAKDEQRKEKMRKSREADRTAKEERLARMEERLYEAEQAFEDWLEKVDLRSQQPCADARACDRGMPWIPV